MTINLYKPLGKTPLEAIELLRKKYPQYAEKKMSYAGRLDPLAEGVLLVLVGEELKNQKKYWGLDKEYEADILFGVETDTYDILGMPLYRCSAEPLFLEPRSRRSGGGEPLPRTLRVMPAPLEKESKLSFHSLSSASTRRLAFGKAKPAFAPRASKNKVRLRLLTRELNKFKGKYTFSLPPYSSYKIDGRPLFWWARNGRLDEVEIPKRTVKIYEIELLDMYEKSIDEVKKTAVERVDMVKGDFRQDEIKKAWQGLSVPPAKKSRAEAAGSLCVAKIRIRCSSGTYIRSIAHDLGNRAGTGAVLAGLKRTRVGEYLIEDSIHVAGPLAGR